MTDPLGAGRTVAFPFAFDPPLDTWARFAAVVPTRSYVRVDDNGFEAVYGPWRVASPWSNVVGVERTGPYRRWRIAGPARLSLVDRGITLAATTAGGVCLRLRQPVKGIDPLGIIRHAGVTLGVDRPDEFVRVVEQRRAVARRSAGDVPPEHRRGRWIPVLRAIWRWNRRAVDHERREVDGIELPALDRAGDADDQPVENGIGPRFHRRYATVVERAHIGAEAAMALVQADPNMIADEELAPFTKVRGESGAMRVGDRYVIEVAGPWKGAVEVIEVTPSSLRLATLEGHMESGVIEMRAVEDVDEGGLTFTIESWARSHDRFLDLMYDKLGIARALQGEMWAIACDRFAALAGGEHTGALAVVTERAG